jgi:hypothetical protein
VLFSTAKLSSLPDMDWMLKQGWIRTFVRHSPHVLASPLQKRVHDAKWSKRTVFHGANKLLLVQ